MFTHATSYDVFVGKVILYPLKITLDLWEEIAYYQLGWQIKDNHMALLPMKFIGVYQGK
jgi:hypothetical protein